VRFTNIYQWIPGDRVMYMGPSMGKTIVRGSLGVVEEIGKHMHIVRVKWNAGYSLYITKQNLRNLTEEEGRT